MPSLSHAAASAALTAAAFCCSLSIIYLDLPFFLEFVIRSFIKYFAQTMSLLYKIFYNTTNYKFQKKG